MASIVPDNSPDRIGRSEISSRAAADNLALIFSDAALKVHESWFKHVKSCFQCSNGLFCEKGNRLAEACDR